MQVVLEFASLDSSIDQRRDSLDRLKNALGQCAGSVSATDSMHIMHLDISAAQDSVSPLIPQILVNLDSVGPLRGTIVRDILTHLQQLACDEQLPELRQRLQRLNSNRSSSPARNNTPVKNPDPPVRNDQLVENLQQTNPQSISRFSWYTWVIIPVVLCMIAWHVFHWELLHTLTPGPAELAAEPVPQPVPQPAPSPAGKFNLFASQLPIEGHKNMERIRRDIFQQALTPVGVWNDLTPQEIAWNDFVRALFEVESNYRQAIEQVKDGHFALLALTQQAYLRLESAHDSALQKDLHQAKFFVRFVKNALTRASGHFQNAASLLSGIWNTCHIWGPSNMPTMRGNKAKWDLVIKKLSVAVQLVELYSNAIVNMDSGLVDFSRVLELGEVYINMQEVQSAFQEAEERLTNQK